MTGKIKVLEKTLGINWTRKKWLRYMAVFAYLIFPLTAILFANVGFLPAHIAAIVMVIIFIVVMIINLNEKTRDLTALEDFAKAHNFSHLETGNVMENFFEKTHLASFKGEIHTLFHNKKKNVEIFVFNYSIGFKHTNEHSVFLVFSKNLNLPHFIMGEKNSADDIFNNHLSNFEKLEISIYDDPDFIRHFTLKGQDVPLINQLFDQNMTSAFQELKNDDLYFEGNRNCFLIHKYRRLNIKECNTLYLTCRKLYLGIVKNLESQIELSKNSQMPVAKQSINTSDDVI